MTEKLEPKVDVVNVEFRLSETERKPLAEMCSPMSSSFKRIDNGNSSI